jgi:hypothetical protein
VQSPALGGVEADKLSIHDVAISYWNTGPPIRWKCPPFRSVKQIARRPDDQATTKPAIQEMPSNLHGAWACNGTSTWYFLDAFDGTPARCSREPGMIECATRVDGRECQWGRLFDKPAPYQPLRGVLTGAVIVVNCDHWRPNDGSDPCAQLGCYSNHAVHECEPETPLPTIEARTVRRTTALILHR